MTTLELWRKANDEAEEAGREVLDGLRGQLADLQELAEAAKREGRRGSLKEEADRIEAAIRNAVSALNPNGREPDISNGESRDDDHVEQVRKARSA